VAKDRVDTLEAIENAPASGTAAEIDRRPEVLTGRSGVTSSARNDDKGKVVRPPIVSDEEGWASASGLNQREAEQLLDWLEANGWTLREVSYPEGQGITVRWRR
jgi:hypothetical protein